jgi:Ribbon-helix-helix protein, copG family
MTARRVSLGDRLRQDRPAPAPAGLGTAAFLPPAPAVEAGQVAPPGIVDRPTAAGDALGTGDAPRAPEAAPGRAEETWEATHKRVTFYCPTDLLEDLEHAVRATGRSKSQLLVAGLRLALRGAAKPRR